MAVANTLDYYETVTITVQKVFIVHAPEGQQYYLSAHVLG